MKTLAVAMILTINFIYQLLVANAHHSVWRLHSHLSIAVEPVINVKCSLSH